MSRENVEIVRDQYAATNERDFARAMSHYAEDVEMVVTHGLRAGTFKGREAVGEWFGEWLAVFDSHARFDIEELLELDASSVLLVANHQASGRKSGVEVTDEVIWLYRVNRGKITHLTGYETRGEAVRALGLR
jgi:ketosteroid isomerase-like protein